jgi:hypothetical protein
MFFASSADNIHLDNGVLYASSQKKDGRLQLERGFL